MWRLRDHPRSRGVYPSHATSVAVTSGSSPLARGLPAGGRPRRLPPRIIPARAGFTRRGPRPRPTVGDHPRSRGVYSDVAWDLGPRCGSSPLARGLPTMTSSICSSLGDHPRSRGVYMSGVVRGATPPGSSPLARGLPHETIIIVSKLRIIPARAGFTLATAPP